MVQQRGRRRREKLLAAAEALFRESGVGGATLAQVAQRAGVPAGGVFYYFPTKQALCAAVADRHQGFFAAFLNGLDEALDDPAARLAAFLDGADRIARDRAQLGCPVAQLAADLSHEGLDAAPAAQVFRDMLAWLERQFRAAGLAAAAARSGAVHLMAGTQGAFALGFALRDEGVIRDEVAALRRWLADALARGPQAP